MVGFRLKSLICAVFFFQGCESFEPGGLPLFRVKAGDWLAASVPGHVGGTFAGASIFTGAFAVGICDLVTFARLVKASSMLWAMLWRPRICLTSVSEWGVWWSKWDIMGVIHDNSLHSTRTLVILSPLNDMKTILSKWRSSVKRQLMANHNWHRFPFFFEDPFWYLVVALLAHRLRTQTHVNSRHQARIQ